MGSKEGWQPSTFRSSRETRGAVQAQSVEQYLDEDELEELRRTNLQVCGRAAAAGGGSGSGDGVCVVSCSAGGLWGREGRGGVLRESIGCACPTA